MCQKFIEPKTISPFFNYVRIPRKLKKKINKILIKHPIYIDVDINVKLWYCLSYTNIEYRNFIISKMCQNGK